MEESEGSLLLGFVLGYFLGCFGIVVAFLMKGSKTLSGAVLGLLGQVVTGMCGFSCLAVFQVFFLGRGGP